ncbi:MAG: hypothetical protein Q4G46_00255, partial [Propionibacteriaceae bacterium]|nr:hypothetical protein [Propionibacteriaceae bacterium]
MSERARRRVRAWLGLWIVAMLCAVYIAGWSFFAGMHQELVGRQLQPGASTVTEDGVQVRILALQQSRIIAGEYR